MFEFLTLFAEGLQDIKAELRYITPPKLTKKHLGKKILCHRPMRRGSPKMSVECTEGKVVVNCYGFGGSGWTLIPGVAPYVNDLLEKSEHSKDLTKDTPIVIIGAGAAGLFAAYDLLKRGYKNIRIIAEKFDHLASHNAGGLLAPVSMDNAPELQDLINKIGIDTYKFYERIIKKQHPDFKSGAILVPSYWETREESGLESYVGVVMKPAKNVVLDFKNGTTKRLVAYDDSIFIDAGQMMKSLKNYVKSYVPFVKKKIKSFADVREKYIINCTGMGAEDLNKDHDMVSVQGHLWMLKDQNPQDLQHMILIYFKERTNEHGQKVKPSFYMFPKRLVGSAPNDVGVIGSTFIEGATEKTPNTEEFDLMIERAKEFYGMKE